MTLTAAPDTRTAPAEPTTPIRPSEAIRLGCLIAPVQAFGTYADGPGTACAVGAMRLGFGGEHRGYYIVGTPRSLRHESKAGWLECPVEGCAEFRPTVAHVNDDHRWTREAIADWLAGQGY